MLSQRTRRLTATAVASAALAVLAGALPASEARKAPKAPKPAPAPTVAPAPTSIQWLVIRPDLAEAVVTPNTQYVEHQLLSGPGVVTPAPVVRGTRGGIYLRGLQPSSTYTFRVRNLASGVTASAWTTFSVTTAATFDSRPAAPRNLRVQSATATWLTVAWDAPDSAFYSYEASLGSTPLLLEGGYMIETQSRTFPRPSPGQTLTFSVAARDVNANLSLPATLEVSSTSAP